MKPRLKLALSVMAKAITVVVTTYIGCYFLRSEVLNVQGSRMRVYGTVTETRLFAPFARVESLLTGHRVHAHHPNIDAQ